MLQTSMQKSSNSIFNNQGKLSLQFFRFKKLLYRITSSETINIKTFITTLVNYTINKYNRQIFKIEKYLIKLESGENVSLRDIFNKDGSQMSGHQEDWKEKNKKEQDKQHKQIEQGEKSKNHSKTRPTKSLKKGQPNNRLSLLKKKVLSSQKQTIRQQKQDSQTYTQKSKTASKLYKFYHLLELNKKQFMQDFIFQQQQKQTKKKQIMNSLIQRNKTIKSQIINFTDKGERYAKTIAQSQLYSNHNILSNKIDDSDQNCQLKNSISKNQNTNNSFKISMRKSFIFSKRKPSLNIQNPNSSGNSDNQSSVCTFFNKTNQNLTSNGQISFSKTHHKTNRMYVVKAPMLFEQQIPQASIHHTGRKDFSSLLKGRQKNNNNMRMRKRNNPIPLQKTTFLDTFRYQQQIK